MAALINFSGLASGIDSKALIQAILDRDRAVKVKPLQDKISELEDTGTGLTKLKGLLNELKTSAQKLRLIAGGPLSKSATSSDETVATAQASSSASDGSYALSISQLAKGATYSLKSTANYSSADSTINSSINNADAAASRTVSVTIGTGSEQEIVDVVLSNSSTLNDFVSSFNSNSTKGVASVVNVGNSSSPDYRVVINSNNSGLEKGQTSISVGASITSSGSGAFNSNSLSQATNASFSISGISGSITRASNTISDVIPGVNLNLQSTGDVTLNVGNDASSSASNFKAFVYAYNKVVSFIAENNLVLRDETSQEVTNTFSPLAKTSIDDNALSALRNALSGSANSGRSVNILADIGITTQRDGTLAFNEDTFKTALADDSVGVSLLGQSLGENLAAVGGTIDQFTRFQGIIDTAISDGKSTISLYEDNISIAEKNLSLQEASLIARFASLEKLVGKLQNQQSSLTAALPR